MPPLEDTLILASTHHKGQVDKAGRPYILHPIRLMQQMKTLEAQTVALLHDIVEDTSVTFDQLRALGYPETIIEAIDGVTRRKEESYEEFVERAKTNPISREVKIADLQDNSDLDRIENPTEKDFERVKKYKRALHVLRS